MPNIMEEITRVIEMAKEDVKHAIEQEEKNGERGKISMHSSNNQ